MYHMTYYKSGTKYFFFFFYNKWKLFLIWNKFLDVYRFAEPQGFPVKNLSDNISYLINCCAFKDYGFIHILNKSKERQERAAEHQGYSSRCQEQEEVALRIRTEHERERAKGC